MAAAAPTRLWTPWRTLYLHVENANVLQYEADVVALKYAQGLHGADREAVEALGKKLPKLVDDMPLSGEFRLVNSLQQVAASQVLFVGTPSLFQFRYGDIRVFATQV